MDGILKNLKPGQQGGGRAGDSRAAAEAKKRNAGSRRQPKVTAAPGSDRLAAAFRKQEGKLRGEKRAAQVQLPEWIRPGERVGYLSRSTGKLARVVIEKINRVDAVVKVVFEEDRKIWKGIPFTMLLSAKSNPLRPLSSGSLAPAGTTSAEKNTLLTNLQATQVDKSIMLGRIGLKEGETSDVRPQAFAAPLVGTSAQKVILDSAIAASSYFMNSSRHGLGEMWRARIDNKESCWRPASDVASQCVRWDLGSEQRVAKIWTKGSYLEDHWVTEYKLSYSCDGSNWTQLETVFEGNQDRDTLAEAILDPPVLASNIRLHPMKWHDHIALRVEIFGSPPEEAGSSRDANDDSEAGKPKEIGPVFEIDSEVSEAGSSRSRSPRR